MGLAPSYSRRPPRPGSVVQSLIYVGNRYLSSLLVCWYNTAASADATLLKESHFTTELYSPSLSTMRERSEE